MKNENQCSLYKASLNEKGVCRYFEKPLTRSERSKKAWDTIWEKRGGRPVHLVLYGDSLGFSKPIWACKKKTNGHIGYFGVDGTISEITCEECKKSELYKDIINDTYDEDKKY